MEKEHPGIMKSPKSVFVYGDTKDIIRHKAISAFERMMEISLVSNRDDSRTYLNAIAEHIVTPQLSSMLSENTYEKIIAVMTTSQFQVFEFLANFFLNYNIILRSMLTKEEWLAMIEDINTIYGDNNIFFLQSPSFSSFESNSSLLNGKSSALNSFYYSIIAFRLYVDFEAIVNSAGK